MKQKIEITKPKTGSLKKKVNKIDKPLMKRERRLKLLVRNKCGDILTDSI